MINDTHLFDVININKSIQGCSGIMPAMKNASCMSTYDKSMGLSGFTLYGSWSFTTWQMQTCFSLMCKLLQGKPILSDCRNNIMVKSIAGDGNIILDCWIKPDDSWVARVKFLWQTNDEGTVLAMAPCKKNINDLHVELGHPSESITHATTKTLSIQVTVTFKPCEDCTLGKAKQWAVSKKAVPWSKILGERLFFNISSFSTPTFVIDDSSDFIVQSSGHHDRLN